MGAPSSRSPGYLVFNYQVDGLSHKMGFALTETADPTDAVAMQVAADHLAPLVAACLSTETVLLDWYTTDRVRHDLLSGTFSADIIGTHGGATPSWHSFTITLTGVETGGDGTYRNGKTRVVVFASGTHQPTAGQKALVVSADTAYSALAADLESSGTYWAGFYGRKANVHHLAPVQFNAAIQKSEGC